MIFSELYSAYYNTLAVQLNFLPAMPIRMDGWAYLSPSCFGIAAENYLRISGVSSFIIKVHTLYHGKSMHVNHGRCYQAPNLTPYAASGIIM